jgi:GNAT superfamily N-acetyltransferase
MIRLTTLSERNIEHALEFPKHPYVNISEERIRDYINCSYSSYYIEKDRNKVGIFTFHKEESWFIIDIFYICEAYRGHGIGSRVLEIMHKMIGKNMGIRTQTHFDNEHAKYFFKINGFHPIGERHAYLIKYPR